MSKPVIVVVVLGILALGAASTLLVFQATRDAHGPAVAERETVPPPPETRAEPVPAPGSPAPQPPPAPPAAESGFAAEPGALLLRADRSPVAPDSPVARAREDDHRRIRRAEWLKNQAAAAKAQR